MGLRVLLLLFPLFCSHVLGENASNLSKEEDLKVEHQLRLLKKHAVKTIRTEEGDLYDCVDYYRQPAFDHPLLKNRKLHHGMRPTSVPKWTSLQERASATSEHVAIGTIDCPIGTVPIMRTTTDDLKRMKSLQKNHTSYNQSLTVGNPGTHYATAHTKDGMNKKYYGANMRITVYNPLVKPGQYSSGQMKIQNGDEIIQVGWTVNQRVYKDDKIRLFTYFHTGKSGCFDLRCPGFVMAANSQPSTALGSIISRSSVAGGPYAYLVITVYKDPINKNWWLLVNDEALVGYWPSSLFTGLSDHATRVEWGGEAYSPSAMPSPPMGSGRLPSNAPDPKSDAYCGLMAVIEEPTRKELVDAEVEPYQDMPSAYLSKDLRLPAFGHIMVFGGPGGVTGN